MFSKRVFLRKPNYPGKQKSVGAFLCIIRRGKNPSSHFFQAKKKGNFFPLSLCAGGNVMVMLRHLYDILGIIEVMFFNFHTLRATYHLRVGPHRNGATVWYISNKKCARALFYRGGILLTHLQMCMHTYIYFPVHISHIKNTKQCS